MSWIKVCEVVHDEAGEIELVLLDAHHDALGEFIASISGRVGSIRQNLGGVGARIFIKDDAHVVQVDERDIVPPRPLRASPADNRHVRG